jgi:hypothetical protein
VSAVSEPYNVRFLNVNHVAIGIPESPVAEIDAVIAAHLERFLIDPLNFSIDSGDGVVQIVDLERDRIETLRIGRKFHAVLGNGCRGRSVHDADDDVVQVERYECLVTPSHGSKKGRPRTS